MHTISKPIDEPSTKYVYTCVHEVQSKMREDGYWDMHPSLDGIDSPYFWKCYDEWSAEYGHDRSGNIL